MKIIHTSDWHIGRSLYGRKRYEEFEAFLDWMAEYIEKENTDILIIAGDIFDTNAPSNRSQELYYRFLCRVAASGCRHVVITAGNHDSPTFLNAPREVLRFLNVHVIGCIGDKLEDEVLLLQDAEGNPEMIVCAVPYLRDRDIRRVDSFESAEDKDRKLLEGIREHYQQVCEMAAALQASLPIAVPIVGMGHLFAAGGSMVEGDGVRELYVGSLAHVGADMFPPEIDYLALGHLHSAQIVSGRETMRYSGSPLPMGFGEAARQKSIVEITFCERNPQIVLIPVPIFRPLQSISGDLSEILQELEELKKLEQPIWVEIVYEGMELISELRQKLDEAIHETSIEILRVKNHRVLQQAITSLDEGELLSELDAEEVFRRCLEANKVPEEQRQDLINAYDEILISIKEADQMAE